MKGAFHSPVVCEGELPRGGPPLAFPSGEGAERSKADEELRLLNRRFAQANHPQLFTIHHSFFINVLFSDFNE